MANTQSDSGTRAGHRSSSSWMIFELAVIIPTVGGLAYLLSLERTLPVRDLMIWTAVVAVVELLPVTLWRGMQMSMAFPLLLAVAFLYSPPAAAGVAFLGSFDLRELRGGTSPLRALFNRAQVAVSVLAAGWVFHLLASVESHPTLLIPAGLVAAALDYLVNMTLVTGAGVILYRLRPVEMIRKLRIGNLSEFLVSYLGLGVLGVVLALLFDRVGFWSVVTFVAPLVFARQMFFRSVALEEAHGVLKQREELLQALSNRMAEERQDERTQIAAYLHDDLAQLLFRLSLQVDIAKRHLSMGDLGSVEGDLESIRETKSRTSEKIRALIRDLHRSPLGRAGLPEAIASFLADVGAGSDVRFHMDVDDLPLPPPIQLLAYHIAREAVMNSLKHADPRNVSISLKPEGETVDLLIRDDGSGFDTSQAGPEGHYGLSMMRERAVVAGGTFEATSGPGRGTDIRVRFPTSWLQEAPKEAEPEGQGSPPAAQVQTEPPPTVPARRPPAPPASPEPETAPRVHRVRA
jgi:signal transduction histidine kinase